LSKVLIVTVLLLGGSFSVKAQSTYSNSDEFWSKVRFGGGLGLSFGNDRVFIGVTPSAIYQANDFIAFGVGLNYTYSQTGDFKYNAFGGSLIALANPVAALQISAEFEQLYVNETAPFFKDSYWLPALYLGVGYGAGPVTIGVRYDVLYDEQRSLYSTPWFPFVRVYF
jgi:hypothetical protein